MDIPLFKKLQQQQLVSQAEVENIEHHRNSLSVYWDVTTLLYLGILLFSSGLAILLYKNVETIGHAVIITTVAVMCLGCFVYCFKNGRGYADEKVESPNLFFDYVLLLGCLLLVTFVGYLQFQFEIFGNGWGQATLVPMVLLFGAAYYFDHLGVLSMAVTNLAAWAGITVAPTRILSGNDFSDQHLIFTGLVLGAGLVAISFVSIYRRIKEHFAVTYKNFGAHVLFISLLAALFHFNTIYLVWFLILATAVVLSLVHAVKIRSFYFLIVTVLYGYIGVSYVFCDLVWRIRQSELPFYLTSIYFVASGIGLIRTLIYYNKTLKKDGHL